MKSSFTPRALRLLALAVLAAFCLSPVLARADDVRAVSFDGTTDVADPLSNNTAVLGTGPETFVADPNDPNKGDFIGAFSATTPFTTSAGYKGPAIYGGYWVHSDDLAGFPGTGAALNRNRILNGEWSLGLINHDNKAGHSLDGTNVTASAAMFMAFQTGATATTHYGFDLNSSVRVNADAVSSGSTVRLVMEVGGQWYVSNLSITEADQTFSGAALLGSEWAAWDPNGGADGRLGDLPSTYDVAGSSFDDIEAVGFLDELASSSANKTLGIDQFSADLDALAVPEPSAVAMLSLGAAVLLLTTVRRRLLFPEK